MYDYDGKLPEQHVSVRMFSNPGETILFLLNFSEARILEWNLCAPLPLPNPEFNPEFECIMYNFLYIFFLQFYTHL